ncbi:hypothetical protein [Lacrimispora sp.]|uniref:hypothetical protein n=1 Tax=Lacrimispora sp. TaxID=2719234 RepID=UPI0028AB4874|nr:hypothetical protein [Lacrimispora sp.]
MVRKKKLISWLICSLMFLFVCFPVWADDNNLGEGSVPIRNGQTDIMAGVAVDYMGKLRFLVLDRDLGKPIAGASVEIFIPSLNRYVLFGLTDSNGIYELDVAYNMNFSVADSDQFVKNDGEDYAFQGTLVYLNDNNIQYRVYKAGWLPYPHEGSYLVKGDKVPETITIKLYQKETKPNQPGPGGSSSGGSSSGGKSPGGTPMNTPPADKPPLLNNAEGTGTSGIPKTGVEGTFPYWAFGFVFFLLAGGTIRKLSKLDNESKETKRRDSDDAI